MNPDLIYMPILKWKKGEQEALNRLTDEQKNKILPIIELVSYDDPDTIINSIKNCYSNPVYVDTITADEEDRDFLVSIIEVGHKNNLKIYPICYIDDLADLLIKLPDYTNRLGIKIPIPEDIENSYIVLKGERDQITRKLTKNYTTLAKDIYESDYYYGENFSYGDLEIKERALGLNKKGPGSNTNWVTISANHHIAAVIEQLSKLV